MIKYAMSAKIIKLTLYSENADIDFVVKIVLRRFQKYVRSVQRS
jgi:hypothetical protein